MNKNFEFCYLKSTNQKLTKIIMRQNLFTTLNFFLKKNAILLFNYRTFKSVF